MYNPRGQINPAHHDNPTSGHLTTSGPRAVKPRWPGASGKCFSPRKLEGPLPVSVQPQLERTQPLALQGQRPDEQQVCDFSRSQQGNQ